MMRLSEKRIPGPRGSSWHGRGGRSLVLGVALSAAALVGCGSSGSDGGTSSGGGVQLSKKPQIQVIADSGAVNLVAPSALQFSTGSVKVGETTTVQVTIRNVGEGDLKVGQVNLSYRSPPGVEEGQGPALEMTSVSLDGTAQAIEDATADAVNKQVSRDIFVAPKPQGPDLVVTIQFRRYNDVITRDAALNIVSNTREELEQTVSIPITTAEAFPVASVQPPIVDFGQVKAGEAPQKGIQVSNTGSADLLINSVSFQGHPDFRLLWDATEYEPLQPIEFATPVVVAPNQFVTFLTKFSPETDIPAEGQVVFYTNDPATPSLKVDLKANTEGPCIQWQPKKVQFGGKLVGNQSLLPVEIISCGTAPLSVKNIIMAEGSNQNFSLTFNTLADGVAPSEAAPLEIPVNGKATFNVQYVPNVVSPLGEGGVPVFDTGFVVIESNAFNSQVEIEVSGLGVDKECPTAVGLIQEGEEVIPQTVLHLFGDQSFAPAGGIASWKWAAKQPTGSASVFIPSDSFPNPTFEVNTAGTYDFRLDVWDESGNQSCVPWEQSVVVIPDEAIHVELLWDTPNDPDPTDQGPEAGSDVDLHFVHDKYAVSGPDLDGNGKPDPWFDLPFDCFWFNAQPNWGSFDPSIDDDPGLDRDDTDGAGPENLNLSIPEDTTYRVGVHYWSDHEYGDSYITLRIYILSSLVFEIQDVQMSNHDMWDAATIDWPSGKVTLVQKDGGGYKITPKYQNPFFFQPGG